MMIKKSIKVAFVCKNKKSLDLDNIDVNKILVSKKESYGTKNSHKYFIGYNDGDIIRPFCILLPKLIDSNKIKQFDSNKTMSFKVTNNKLLKSIKRYGKRLAIY